MGDPTRHRSHRLAAYVLTGHVLFTGASHPGEEQRTDRVYVNVEWAALLDEPSGRQLGGLDYLVALRVLERAPGFMRGEVSGWPSTKGSSPGRRDRRASTR